MNYNKTAFQKATVSLNILCFTEPTSIPAHGSNVFSNVLQIIIQQYKCNENTLEDGLPCLSKCVRSQEIHENDPKTAQIHPWPENMSGEPS